MGLNIYIADTKNEDHIRLKTFEGLSVGETRGFLYDLCIRDVRKNDYVAVVRTLGSKIDSLYENQQSATAHKLFTSAILSLDAETLKERIESIIYDEISAHELLTTVWNFSDKTAIIVKA